MGDTCSLYHILEAFPQMSIETIKIHVTERKVALRGGEGTAGAQAGGGSAAAGEGLGLLDYVKPPSQLRALRPSEGIGGPLSADLFDRDFQWEMPCVRGLGTFLR